MAVKLGCTLVPVKESRVTVANGQELRCSSICKAFTWKAHEQSFEADVYILPLENCDLILGAQWLSTLGDILWNFETLTMKFVKGNKPYTLRGQEEGSMAVVSRWRKL